MLPDTLRVMTLNVAHGRGLAWNQALVRRHTLRANLERVGRVLGRESACVVALQEADGPSTWSGGFDHVSVLADHGGYPHRHRGDHGRVARGPVRLDYGTALLSRLPLAEARSRPFDRTWRDTKGFVSAAVRPPALDHQPVHVFSVHLDFARARVREAQAERLIEEVGRVDGHFVILGDLNCRWSGEGTVRRLVQALGARAWRPAEPAPTFPARTPRARIDWILISEELDFAAHRVLPDAVSDHRAVVADLVLRAA